MTTLEFELTRGIMKRNSMHVCHKCLCPFQVNDIITHQGRAYYHKECFKAEADPTPRNPHDL